MAAEDVGILNDVVPCGAGWRYLVLGAMCLWLCGFEITRRQRTPPPGPQTPDGEGGSQQQPNGDGHQQLHSALHQPGAGAGSPKRVSFEHGTASSQVLLYAFVCIFHSLSVSACVLS